VALTHHHRSEMWTFLTCLLYTWTCYLKIPGELSPTSPLRAKHPVGVSLSHMEVLPWKLGSIGKALPLRAMHTSNVSPRYIDVLPLELQATQVGDTTES
jgi:hypothetical protein